MNDAITPLSAGASVEVPRFVRLRLEDMASLAKSQAADIFDGHGRTYVGPAQRALLRQLGVPVGAQILPIRGSWPRQIEEWMNCRRHAALTAFRKANT